ncbi:MAG: lipoprotein [Saprospiraceae bacterium]|nr:MAG: lipoprotein [Saprospiraceae bacterium]
MKRFIKIIIYLFSLLLINNISAQPPEIAWQLSLGDTFDDFAFKMITTKDKGLLILSSTVPLTDTLHGFDGGDIKLYKLDKDRKVEWSKVWRGHNTEKPIDACQTEDGFLVVAYSNSSDLDFSENYGLNDIWILKLTSTGDLLWKKNYGGSGHDSPQRVIATSEQHFIVVANTNSIDHDIQNLYGGGDTWLFEIDDMGEILRSKNFGGSNNDHLSDALLLDNGNLILVGGSASNDLDVPQNSGETDGWVLELDEDWNVITSRTYGGSKVDFLSSVEIATDGFIIGGTSYSENAGMPSNSELSNSNVWLLKLNDFRSKVWSKLYGGSKLEYTSKIEYFNDQIILFGNTISNDGDISYLTGLSGSFWLLLLDRNGNIIWEKTLGGSEGESGRDLLITELGEILLLGESESKDGDLPLTPNIPYNKNIWLVGLTSIFPDTLANSCNDFILAPNPITLDQSLQFHFPEAVSLPVQLDYFDTMGKKIGATQQAELIGQNPEIDLPRQLASGTYFLQLTTSQNVCIQKLVVIDY